MYLFGHIRSLGAAYEIWFPDQGLNPDPLRWEHGVLATGPPGKSLNVTFCEDFFSSSQFKAVHSFKNEADVCAGDRVPTGM